MIRKIALLSTAVILSFFASVAQDKKPLSPKETVKDKIGNTNVEVNYSRPSSRGRKMIGGNERYGEVWRTGANEATTIEFDSNVKVEGKDLAKGKYALFTIPGEKEWVIIFNKEVKQWGHYSYNQKEDVLRVTVPAKKPDSFVETFTISIEKDDVVLKWENSLVSFKVK